MHGNPPQDVSEIACHNIISRFWSDCSRSTAFWVAFGAQSEIRLILWIRRVAFFGLALLFAVFTVTSVRLDDHKSVITDIAASRESICHLMSMRANSRARKQFSPSPRRRLLLLLILHPISKEVPMRVSKILTLSAIDRLAPFALGRWPPSLFPLVSPDGPSHMNLSCTPPQSPSPKDVPLAQSLSRHSETPTFT